MDEQGKCTGVQQKIAGQLFPSSHVLSVYLTSLNGFCFQVAIQSFLSHVKINTHSLLRHVVKTISMCSFWTWKLCFVSFALCPLLLILGGANQPLLLTKAFVCSLVDLPVFSLFLPISLYSTLLILELKASHLKIWLLFYHGFPNSRAGNPSVPSNDTFLWHLLSRRSSANWSCSALGLREPLLKHCCGTLQRWF